MLLLFSWTVYQRRLEVISLLFDAAIFLASSNVDLSFALELFMMECNSAGLIILQKKLVPKKLLSPGRDCDYYSLPLVEVFKKLQILFRSNCLPNVLISLVGIHLHNGL